jgi:hypothetical protein
MSDQEKTHVVVTRYVIFGRPQRRPLFHTYGPYTFHHATHVRKTIRARYSALIESGSLEVSSCKVLDDTVFVSDWK